MTSTTWAHKPGEPLHGGEADELLALGHDRDVLDLQLLTLKLLGGLWDETLIEHELRHDVDEGVQKVPIQALQNRPQGQHLLFLPFRDFRGGDLPPVGEGQHEEEVFEEGAADPLAGLLLLRLQFGQGQSGPHARGGSPSVRPSRLPR